MNNITTALLQTNIFLAIEHYLAYPGRENAENVKQLSHSLTNQAYEQARLDNPDPGADEYQPLLLATIQEQAEIAAEYSARLINNSNITEADPAYIFKISQEQAKKIQSLFVGMTDDKQQRHREGLIFAYNAYIERRESEPETGYSSAVIGSALSYCNPLETVLYNHNALLNFQARKLREKGSDEAAQVLQGICNYVKQVCETHPELIRLNADELNEMKGRLFNASEHPSLQNNNWAKQLVVNFLLAISVVGLFYLYKTQTQRHSFWYQPSTMSQDLLQSFDDELIHNNL